MVQVPYNMSGFVEDNPIAPRFLLIQADAQGADAVRAMLLQHYGQDCLTHARSLGEALSLNLDEFDLALTATLVSESGLDVLEELLLIRPDLPIVVLATDYHQPEAARAMREGAYDYVVMAAGYLDALPSVIEKNLALHRVKQENARLQVQLTATLGQLRTRNEQLQGLVKELKAIAATDALTGIPNRRAVTQSLDRHYAEATRQNTDLAVIAIDLDGFKQLNDACGHPAGDRVLMLVARVLTANARASDLAGRIGGDEFIVVLPNTGAEESRRVAKRIHADFALAFADLASQVGYTGAVSLSLGIATRRVCKSATSDELLVAADRSLYRAKDAGRSCVVMHGEAI